MREESKHKLYGAASIAVILFFAIGYVYGAYVEKRHFIKFVGTFKNLREGGNRFSYTDPLVGTISAPATDVGIFTNLKEEVSDYLDQEEKKGNLYDFSFYFKELNSPLWFGINESESFFPASLFKLPIAIAAYREGEDNPAFLKKRIVYTKELAEANENISGNEKSKLVIGAYYSVEELVRTMLEDSDNGAKDLLAVSISKRYVEDLFGLLNLSLPSPGEQYTISSRRYAFFLRALYNGSYLYPQHSEYILSLLAKSTFKNGLVAGLPKDMIVAHKFGTYKATATVDGKQVDAFALHDCGIVYNGDDPFLMCFMTKGKDLETLYRVISHVTGMVYDFTQSED